MMRPGPTTWFVGADGKGAGIDYDLAQLFAREHHGQLPPVRVHLVWQPVNGAPRTKCQVTIT